MKMNSSYRKPLLGTQLDFFDVREAVNTVSPGSYDKLPYTSRVLAEQIVRRCDSDILIQSLEQIIYRKRDHDFPLRRREFGQPVGQAQSGKTRHQSHSQRGGDQPQIM